ncbi:helix-turn-helix domain-containing protein [Agromyces larvae]|uniref:Helix-turn-helix domain-containing protein n=1 Tax=Agromyces larvae TaxID=2929802 RepID=A0ABY4C2G0_9MICO|nr:helix-turn-helix domain-containing protein [Agromyces larvae]UOE45514.1 helix-turn-helix domain-containing protein [Agromyces larvae]
MRAREAAAYCGIAYQTLMNLRSLGQGPRGEVHGRLVVFHEDDLDEWKRQYFTREAARDAVKLEHAEP